MTTEPKQKTQVYSTTAALNIIVPNKSNITCMDVWTCGRDTCTYLSLKAESTSPSGCVPHPDTEHRFHNASRPEGPELSL